MGHLVIDRKQDQEIIVDGPARIRVGRIRSGRSSVKLLVIAPATTKVIRNEHERPPEPEAPDLIGE